MRHRWRSTIAYAVLVLGMVFAIYQTNVNQTTIEIRAAEDLARSKVNLQRIERQSAEASRENCEAINDGRTALDKVLREILLIPREEDAIGDVERRVALYERVEGLVLRLDCPPVPENGVIENQRDQETTPNP